MLLNIYECFKLRCYSKHFFKLKIFFFESTVFRNRLKYDIAKKRKRRFIDTLVAQKVPSLLAKSYCNSAVQLLISSAACPVRADDLFAINYLRTVDDYLSFVQHMLQPEPERPDEAQEEQQSVSELLGRIYAYVAENYDDCNFSLQDAADKLGLYTVGALTVGPMTSGDDAAIQALAAELGLECSK